jgi:predicted ribosomally synthesized peptide with nif11-like leader
MKMSIESANRFLKAVAQDQVLRNQLQAATTPQEFLQVSDRLGYCFTTAELQELISQMSRDVKLRRSTGVWPWLRSANWV